MTLIKLKYIDRFTDRHGRKRFYFRRDRGPRIPLPGRPGSPEFTAAYECAAVGEMPEKGPKQRGAPGTFDRLVQDYFSSPGYLRLAPSSQKTYRSVIERLLIDEGIGHRLVREMSREHVRRIVSKRSETPGTANSMADKIARAGLPDRCVTHGLRKAAARRLAEAGCTANEIAAITGHATLQEVSRYTKAAEQGKREQAAMRRLSARRPITDSQTAPRSLGILPKNHNVSSGLAEGWWSRGESNP